MPCSYSLHTKPSSHWKKDIQPNLPYGRPSNCGSRPRDAQTKQHDLAFCTRRSCVLPDQLKHKRDLSTAVQQLTRVWPIARHQKHWRSAKERTLANDYFSRRSSLTSFWQEWRDTAPIRNLIRSGSSVPILTPDPNETQSLKVCLSLLRRQITRRPEVGSPHRTDHGNPILVLGCPQSLREHIGLGPRFFAGNFHEDSTRLGLTYPRVRDF